MCADIPELSLQDEDLFSLDRASLVLALRQHQDLRSREEGQPREDVDRVLTTRASDRALMGDLKTVQARCSPRHPVANLDFELGRGYRHRNCGVPR
jgi:hypothetical protein